MAQPPVEVEPWFREEELIPEDPAEEPEADPEEALWLEAPELAELPGLPPELVRLEPVALLEVPLALPLALPLVPLPPLRWTRTLFCTSFTPLTSSTRHSTCHFVSRDST